MTGSDRDALSREAAEAESFEQLKKPGAPLAADAFGGVSAGSCGFIFNRERWLLDAPLAPSGAYNLLSVRSDVGRGLLDDFGFFLHGLLRCFRRLAACALETDKGID